MLKRATATNGILSFCIIPPFPYLRFKIKGRVVSSATRHYELLVFAFHAHCGESYTNHYSNHAKQWYKTIQALSARIDVSHGTTTGAISNCAQAIRECIGNYVE